MTNIKLHRVSRLGLDNKNIGLHRNIGIHKVHRLGLNRNTEPNKETDYFDFENIDFKEDLIFLEDFEEKKCEDNFLTDFNTFIKKIRIVTAKNLDCEVTFYKSEEEAQKNPKYGTDDKSYNGSFGFDSYKENLSGKGDLSLKYFPNIKSIDDDYKASFLSLWPPKSKFDNILKTSPTFKPTTKAKIWFKITQNEKNKDKTKSSGNLYYDTGTSNLLINGKQKGSLFAANNANFNIGNIYSLNIECTNILTDYTFITFKETDQNGKVVGILNVVPNHKIYTTNINLINVNFSSINSLRTTKTDYSSFAKPLQQYLNTQCFNQALIYITVANDASNLQVNKFQIPSIITNDGKNYIKNSKTSEQEFSTAINDIYNNLLAVNNANKEESDYAKIRKIIDEMDTNLFNTELLKYKKEAKKSALKLLDTIIKQFNRYKREMFRIAKTYEDTKVKEAIIKYKKDVFEYRKELYHKTIDKINSYTSYNKLIEYKRKIEEAILNNKSLSRTVSSISMDTTNTIYMFLYKDIEGFQTDDGVVAGFTKQGDGFVHIFNLALRDNTKKNGIIAHELGHAFGLEHTFKMNQKEIEKEFKDRLKEFEKKRNTSIKLVKHSNNSSVKVTSSPKIEAFYTAHLEKTLEPLKESIKLLRLNTDLKNIDNLIDISMINSKIEIERKMRGKPAKTTLEIENKFQSDILDLKNKKTIDLEKTIDLSKKQSIENFLDYNNDLERKNFWYWQWQTMYCNTKPLKENRL